MSTETYYLDAKHHSVIDVTKNVSKYINILCINNRFYCLTSNGTLDIIFATDEKYVPHNKIIDRVYYYVSDIQDNELSTFFHYTSFLRGLRITSKTDSDKILKIMTDKFGTNYQSDHISYLYAITKNGILTTSDVLKHEIDNVELLVPVITRYDHLPGFEFTTMHYYKMPFKFTDIKFDLYNIMFISDKVVYMIRHIRGFYLNIDKFCDIPQHVDISKIKMIPNLMGIYYENMIYILWTYGRKKQLDYPVNDIEELKLYKSDEKIEDITVNIILHDGRSFDNLSPIGQKYGDKVQLYVKTSGNIRLLEYGGEQVNITREDDIKLLSRANELNVEALHTYNFYEFNPKETMLSSDKILVLHDKVAPYINGVIKYDGYNIGPIVNAKTVTVHKIDNQPVLAVVSIYTRILTSHYIFIPVKKLDDRHIIEIGPFNSWPASREFVQHYAINRQTMKLSHKKFFKTDLTTHIRQELTDIETDDLLKNL